MIIAWSTAHQEFTINDYYYYSALRELISRNGVELVVIDEIKDLSQYKVVVFNYPEKEFKNWERELLHKFMFRGGRVIILGYYNNEDNVADYVNSLTRDYGIIMNDDAVVDKINKVDDEGLLITTSRIYGFNHGVKKILLPCTASLRALNNKPINIVQAEETAVSTKYGRSPSLFKLVRVGAGELIVGGTCVFWDNFSIKRFDNEKFAINILIKENKLIQDANRLNKQ